jgi:hypothetical protein
MVYLRFFVDWSSLEVDKSSKDKYQKSSKGGREVGGKGE